MWQAVQRGRVLNKPTPERILAAAERELGLVIKRLIICRNRLYKETGNYPDDLGAAIERAEFLLCDLMAGLISPVEAKTRSAKATAANPPVTPPERIH
jgi:hypothetical protein